MNWLKCFLGFHAWDEVMAQRTCERCGKFQMNIHAVGWVDVGVDKEDK